MDNIILIGMPGTGKSTVGVVLAKLLGYDFLDTDILISKLQKKPLWEIISEKGFEGFVDIEGNVGADLNCCHTVVATGGSMVFSEAAMKNLSRLGVIVWLDTPVSIIEERISDNLTQRGVATPRSMTVAEIYDDRGPLYKRWCNIRFDCRGNTEDVVKSLISSLSGYQKP